MQHTAVPVRDERLKRFVIRNSTKHCSPSFTAIQHKYGQQKTNLLHCFSFLFSISSHFHQFFDLAGSKSNTNIPLNEPALAQAALDAASAATRRPRPFHKFNAPPGGEVRVNGKRLSSGETPPANAAEANNTFARPAKFVKREATADAQPLASFVAPPPVTLHQPGLSVPPPVQLPDPTSITSRALHPSLTPRFIPDVPFPSSVTPHTASRQLSAFLGLPITPHAAGQPTIPPYPSNSNGFPATIVSCVPTDLPRDDPPSLPPPLNRHLSSISNQSNLGADFMRQSSSDDGILPPPWTVNDVEGGSIPLISCRSDSSQAALVAEMTQVQASGAENLQMDARNAETGDRPPGEPLSSRLSSTSSGKRKLTLSLPIGGPGDDVVTPSGLNCLETPSSGEDNTPYASTVLQRLPSTISPTGSSANAQWTSWMNGILQSDKDPTEQDDQQSNIASDDAPASSGPPSITPSSLTPFLNDMIYTPRTASNGVYPSSSSQYSLPSPTNAGLLPLSTRGMGFDTLLSAPPTARASGVDDQTQSTTGTENSKRPFS